MQFAILTAVLAAIAAAESGGGPVAGVTSHLLVVAGATLIAPLAALVGTYRVASSVVANEDSEDAILWLQTIVVCLWLGAVALILFVGQWPRIVRSNWRLEGWPLVDELAILLPVIAPLLLVWAVLYRLDRAAQVAACAARTIAPPPPSLINYLWSQVRHQLILVVLPPLVVVGLFEVVASLPVGGAEIDTVWWFVFPLVGMMVVLMPAAVRRVWQTAPLVASPLRQRLDDVCRDRRCQVRDILIWHTGGTMANAAVVGMSRWLRYMLLTDVLVSHLSDDQLAAVARHELAHLRRWHLPLRLAALLLPVAWWLAIKQLWPGVETALETFVVSLGVPSVLAANFGIPLALLAYAFIIVGAYSRLLEHDADLDACLDGHGRIDPAVSRDLCSALLRLCGGRRESRLSQWLHPPVYSRVKFIRRAAGEPSLVCAFRFRFGLVAGGIAALYLAAAVFAALA
jgi:Zn-dependent protease with chaperone function